MKPDDPQLQALFSKQATADRAQAPTFAHTCQPRAPRTIRWLPLALAAALLLAAGLLLPSFFRSQQPPVITAPIALDPAEIPSIVDWQSPTAFLLYISNDPTDDGAPPASRSATSPDSHRNL